MRPSTSTPLASSFYVALVVLLTLTAIGPARCLRFAAGDDVVVDADRRLYVAYIVQENDIMVKKACVCMPRRLCGAHEESVHLTE